MRSGRTAFPIPCAAFIIYPMRAAFKEWAIIVDALLRGEQTVILRKGGISEGPGGFKLERPEFLLFPTRFHQQREGVIAAAAQRFDALAAAWPDPSLVRIEGWARVEDWRRVESLQHLAAFHGRHIWREEIIRERFDWGRSKSIYALGVRVFRLPQARLLPNRPEYGGCKSWVELDQEIDLSGSEPVLSDGAFSARLEGAFFNEGKRADTEP